MKTKLTDKQKAEVVKGARVAAARPTDAAFDTFWHELTGDDPAIHGKRISKPALIRPRGR